MITPRIIPEIRQIILTPQIQKKLFLIWSLISTPASPVPRNVAGTTGLIKVAQLRHTTIAMAICAGFTPNSFPIPISTGSIPKKKESVSNSSVRGTDTRPTISGKNLPIDYGTTFASTLAI